MREDIESGLSPDVVADIHGTVGLEDMRRAMVVAAELERLDPLAALLSMGAQIVHTQAIPPESEQTTSVVTLLS